MATYNINVLCDNKAVNTAEFDIQSTVCKWNGLKTQEKVAWYEFLNNI